MSSSSPSLGTSKTIVSAVTATYFSAIILIDSPLTSSVTAARLLMAELTVEREPENIPATARPGSPGTEDILSTM